MTGRHAAALRAPAAPFGARVTDYLSGHTWTHQQTDPAWYTCPTCGGGVQVWQAPTGSAQTVQAWHLLTSGLLAGCPGPGAP
jgi:hypothetical protein